MAKLGVYDMKLKKSRSKEIDALMTDLMKQKSKFQKRLFAYFNSNVPLEERWALYRKACIGRIIDDPGGWIEDVFVGGVEITLHEDVYYERYQEVWYYDLIERLEDLMIDGDHYTFTQKDIDELKEVYIRSKKSGFRMDW